MNRQNKKQHQFNLQLDQYYMYQITESLVLELQNYIHHHLLQYEHLIQFTTEVTNCSGNIYIRNFEDSDIGSIFHMHREDVYYIQRHYQRQVHYCIKRLKLYIEYLENYKEDIQ